MSGGSTEGVVAHVDAHAGGAVAVGDGAHASSTTNNSFHYAAPPPPPAVTQEDLCAFYKEKRNKISRVLLEDSYPIEQAYVNLTIIDSVEQAETEEELVSFEDYFRPRTAIDIEAILQMRGRVAEAVPPIRILIEGTAGVGKSTFCDYLSYRWRMGSWAREYEYLISLPLRDYQQGLRDGKKLPKILAEYYESRDPRDFGLLLENRDKVLWIFDGYDEILENKKLKKEFEEQFVDTAQGYHWIITTRPQKVGMLKRHATAHLALMGLTQDNIQAFIEKYFAPRETPAAGAAAPLTPLVKQVMTRLETQPRLRALASIPVILDLLCWAEQRAFIRRDASFSVTGMGDLYQKIIEGLILRYKDSPLRSAIPEAVLLTKMGRLAWDMMRSRAIIIGEKELSNLTEDDIKAFLDFGLIRRFGGSESTEILYRFDRYCFIHLTFQEALAALYLVSEFNEWQAVKPPALKPSQGGEIKFSLEPVPRTLQEDAKFSEKWLADNHQNQRYRMMFIFMAGMSVPLAKGGQSLLILFKDLFFDSPWRLGGLLSREVTADRFYQTILWMNLLQESWALDFKDRDAILAEITDNFIDVKGAGIRKMTEELNRLEIIKERVLASPSIDKYFASYLKGESLTSEALTKLLLLDPLPAHLQKYLTETLQHPDIRVREKVVQIMGGYKGENPQFIEHLLTILHKESIEKSGSENLQLEMIVALQQLFLQFAHIPEKWLDIPKALQRRFFLLLLKDFEYSVNSSAVKALSKIALGDEKTICSLLLLLKDADSDLEVCIVEALGKAAPLGHEGSIRSLLPLLKKFDPYVRKSAAEALGKVAPLGHEESINFLLGLLKDPKPWVRISALDALGKLAPLDHPAARAEAILSLLLLLKKTDSTEADLRMKVSAAEALGKLAPLDHPARAEAIPSLLLLLKKTDSTEADLRMKISTAEALGKLAPLEHPARAEAICSLLSLFTNDSMSVSMSAAEALGRVALGDEETISSLMLLCKHANFSVRRGSAKILGKVAPLGHEVAIGFLLRLLEDADMQHLAAEALAKVAPLGHPAREEAIRSLLRLLQVPKLNFTNYALEVLGVVVPRGHEATILALLVLIKKTEYRYDSIGALGAVAPRGYKAAIDALLPILKEDEANGAVAASALAQISPLGHTETIRALLRVLKNRTDYKHVSNGWYAAKALAQISPSNHEEIIGALLFVSKSKKDEAFVRSYAIQALSEIWSRSNPSAATALPDVVDTPPQTVTVLRDALASPVGAEANGGVSEHKASEPG